MKLLLRLARESWPTLTLATVLGGLSGAANVGLLAIVNRQLRHAGTSTSTLVWAFVGVCLVALVTRIASQIYLVRMSQNSLSRLRIGLCRRILEAPLRQLEEIGTPRMIGALTADVTIVGMALNALPSVVVSVIILICGMVYLGFLNAPLLAAGAVFGVAGGVTYWATARLGRKYLSDSREANDVLLTHVRSLINGVKELKMNAARREEFVVEAIERSDQDVRENQFQGTVIQDAAVVWGRMLFLVAIGLLLFAWPHVRPTDSDTLIGFALGVFYLMSPLERIFAYLPLLYRAGLSVNKINKIGLLLDERPPEARGATTSVAWESIEFAGVTHEYRREGQEGGFLVGPIDWRLTPGEIVFLVGGNGSGKTTLMKLLTGLYSPRDGRLLLDERPVDDGNREAYRQLFAVVFDDGMVFEGLYGTNREDREARARQYLRDLKLDHVVSIADGKFSTTELSRGQRKRLALLTAYLEDRSIYVFDEWAADQDPSFKKVFYEQLLPELKRRGKTVVAITHDDRYFAVADRIVKMEDGRLADGVSLLSHSEA